MTVTTRHAVAVGYIFEHFRETNTQV